MNSVVARFGSFESRAVSQTLRGSGKRKRGDWACGRCRARTGFKQLRRYSDDTLNSSPESIFFPFGSSRNEEETKSLPRYPKDGRPKRRRAWGLSADNSEAASDVHTRPTDLGKTEEEEQIALWERFEKAEEQAAESDEDGASAGAWETNAPVSAPLLAIDYAAELPQALANNEPDTVARCLYAADRQSDVDFLRSIPPTTFAECIRILQPCNFSEQLTTPHLEISHAVSKQLGFTSINQVASQHAKILQDVLSVRRNAGIKVGLPEYRMLLRGVRDLGQSVAARKIWGSLLSDGLSPDTACFNHMMSAHIWNDVHDPLARQTVRVIPFFQQQRRLELQPSVRFANYKIGSGGLKDQVMNVFRVMLKSGAFADEESYCNVISAAAREGDIATVKSVLRKAWDVDVEKVVAGKPNKVSLPQAAETNSPLRPTSKLLFTIAHAYGINNDVPMALRLVDAVARRFDMTIDRNTWNQLLEWTFVLATPRTGIKAKTDGSRAGQLPPQSVLSLWQTMTGSPYFVQPTIGMYNHLIKMLREQNSPSIMYEKMCEGLQLYFESRRRASQKLDELRKVVSNEDGAVIHRSPQAIRLEWEHLDLVRKRNLFWCKRWLRIFLTVLMDSNRVGHQVEWPLRDIPQALWDWRKFAPTRVWYETIGGLIEFDIRTEEEIQSAAQFAESTDAEIKTIKEKVPLYIAEEWARPQTQFRWTHAKEPRKRLDSREPDHLPGEQVYKPFDDSL